MMELRNSFPGAAAATANWGRTGLVSSGWDENAALQYPVETLAWGPDET